MKYNRIGDLDISIDANHSYDSKLVDIEKHFIQKELYDNIYAAGEADNQETYETHYDLVFLALDKIEKKLEGKKYLLGDEISQADVKLYSILVRFDVIYYFAFRLNRNHIEDFKNIFRYAKSLYKREEFRKATDFEKFKKEFYLGLDEVANPYRLVADGPDMSRWEE